MRSESGNYAAGENLQISALKWQKLDEMADLPTYAPKWGKWSYGGHTGDEMVIRNRDARLCFGPDSAFVTDGEPVRSLIVSSLEGEK